MSRNRVLKFQQIVDSSFGESIGVLNKRIEKICHGLVLLPGVDVKISGPRKVTFGKDCVQWRADFWVYKNRRTTWDEVMETVNNIKAPVYKFI